MIIFTFSILKRVNIITYTSKSSVIEIQRPVIIVKSFYGDEDVEQYVYVILLVPNGFIFIL